MTRKELVENIRRKQTFLCVGLDPDIRKIPQSLLRNDNPVLDFCKAIVDATAPYCVAYKPNLAFFESMGVQGWIAFEETVRYIRNRYPDQLIIADAKRGDIGNTSSMYARSFFGHMGVDALTVAPYMGEDSVKPFLDYEGKWVILLALTSNKGSLDFQMITDAGGTPLFDTVMRRAMTWASPDKLMFVVGATRGELFDQVRRIAPENFLLVPGVGAQGGSLAEVAQRGMIADCGLLVNSSRGIIYASADSDFADAAGRAAAALAAEMADLLKKGGVI